METRYRVHMSVTDGQTERHRQTDRQTDTGLGSRAGSHARLGVPYCIGVPCWVWDPVLGQGSCADSGIPCWVGGAPWNSENSFNGFVDPKNLGVAFDFAFLSCLVFEL